MTEQPTDERRTDQADSNQSRPGALRTVTRQSALSNMGDISGIESALSEPTRHLEKLVNDLRIPPSPASLPIGERTLEERLFDATANVKILTSQVAMHLDREWRDRLFRQLDALHDPIEWETGDEPVKQGSFATFLKAIVGLRPQKRPGLGLSHSGHLIAAWTNGSNRLTVEFLNNDRVRWVIGRRDSDDEPEQIAGQTAVSKLASALAPYNSAIWFSI